MFFLGEIMQYKILGIDIGGSGIKGAVVNVKTAELVSERLRIPTPQLPTPYAVANTVRDLIDKLEWKGVVGCSFPMVVEKGECMTAGNMSDDWIGIQIDTLFESKCPDSKFYLGNDADLAGMAEVQLGAGKGLNGKVIMVTIGTGLGSGVFYNGVLIPNIELGRVLYKDGRPIEFYASGRVRKLENLELKDWAARFDFFLTHVKRVMSPDHFVIGGGLSKKFELFKENLSVNIPLHLAQFGNNAGIIGAALHAESCLDMTQ